MLSMKTDVLSEASDPLHPFMHPLLPVSKYNQRQRQNSPMLLLGIIIIDPAPVAHLSSSRVEHSSSALSSVHANHRQQQHYTAATATGMMIIIT